MLKFFIDKELVLQVLKIKRKKKREKSDIIESKKDFIQCIDLQGEYQYFCGYCNVHVSKWIEILYKDSTFQHANEIFLKFSKKSLENLDKVFCIDCKTIFFDKNVFHHL